MSTFIASFDIGKKNLAFCIEEIKDIDRKALTSIKDCEGIKYNKNGTLTQDFKIVLDQVCKLGKTIHAQVLDITQNCDPKLKLDPESFYNMYDLFEKYTDYWEKCDIIIIEEQMSFGNKINKMACKLAQHCYSYFVFKYGREKTVLEFPAYNKTQVLGAPKIEGKKYKNGNIKYKAMTQSARKKWSVKRTIEILESRNDSENINFLNNKKKKDDIADTITQLQAFKYMLYVERSIRLN